MGISSGNLLQFAIEAMAQSKFSGFTQLENGGSFHNIWVCLKIGYP